MGTSKSSGGPKSGPDISLVPEGVPAVPVPIELQRRPADPASSEPAAVISVDNLPLPARPEGPPVRLQTGRYPSPPRRFAGTRTAFSRFARSGSTGDLRKGLGRYVRSGLGGTGRAVGRMGNTVRTATNLYNVLSALRAGRTPTGLEINPKTLAGRSAREVMDIVIEAIRPSEGGLDAEANRQAMAEATSDLIEAYEDAEIQSLTMEQIEFMIEHFVAHDLCQQVYFAVGATIEKNAPDHATAVLRIEKVADYVTAQVHAVFAARQRAGEHLNKARIGGIITAVIRDVFQIFDEYLQ